MSSVSMGFPLRPFDPGLPMGSSHLLEPLVVQDSTTWMGSTESSEIVTIQPTLTNMDTSTPESVLQNNEEASNDRLTNSRKRTRSIESSPTSPPVSTSRGRDCVPFWNELTKGWSEKLWSCTETGLQDSPVTYWSSYSAKKDAGSWFTVEAKVPNQPSNSPMTLWPSQQSLWQVITENEQRKIEESASASSRNAKKARKAKRSRMNKTYQLPRVHKVRVYPNKTERDTIRKWFGLTRRAYNISVEVNRKLKNKDPEITSRVSAFANEVKRDKKNNGRPIIKVDDNGKLYHLTRGWKDAMKMVIRHMEKEENFVKECPQAIRDSGIRDFEKAMRSGDAKNEEKRERDEGEDEVEEQFKFRSRKGATQTFEINARDWKSTSKQGKLFQLMKTKKECVPKKADCAVRVQMDKLGRVFMCFVREVETKSENQTPCLDGVFHGTAVLDPGVRTFQAIYDADGQGIEWGKGDMNEIFRLCRLADGIKTKMSKKRATWTLRRAYYRALRKIKDKIKECHRKLALFLCENFRVVMIPKFQVSRMIKRRNRKLNSKTVRMMCSWSHYAFREALKAKTEMFPWVQVVEVDEAYTSKTCEECGHLHQKLGRSKVFKCPNCGHRADRDLHAARNILLRYLTRAGIPVPERLVF